MMRAVLVGGLVVGGGCVSAQRTTYTQAFARTATNVQTFDLKYTAESILDGETLKVTVTSEEQCRTSATPIYRRTAHIERKPAQVGLPIFTPLYLAIYGVAGAGYGAVIYADTSADDQSTGIALMGVGGALLT